jgi:hypothetical protein
MPGGAGCRGRGRLHRECRSPCAAACATIVISGTGLKSPGIGKHDESLTIDGSLTFHQRADGTAWATASHQEAAQRVTRERIGRRNDGGFIARGARPSPVPARDRRRLIAQKIRRPFAETFHPGPFADEFVISREPRVQHPEVRKAVVDLAEECAMTGDSPARSQHVHRPGPAMPVCGEGFGMSQGELFQRARHLPSRPLPWSGLPTATPVVCLSGYCGRRLCGGFFAVSPSIEWTAGEEGTDGSLPDRLAPVT